MPGQTNSLLDSDITTLRSEKGVLRVGYLEFSKSFDDAYHDVLTDN